MDLADKEAIEVGRVYPKSTLLVGSDATARRFVSANHEVIHFAGHAVVNTTFPSFSRLLMAPDPTETDDGTLFAGDIARRRFDRTRVMVLATCSSAAGRFVDGEGILSIGRAFLETGIPSVVASLWPVDERAHALLIAFHRELRTQLDVASALRAAQLRFIQDQEVDTPVRLWGGFVALGGLASPQMH